MAARRECFSKITGQYISEDYTVIAAYKTNRTIRVFFESVETLRELKFRADKSFASFTGSVLPLRLHEKDPAKGATKNTVYFMALGKRAQKAQIKTVSSEDAETVINSLLSADRKTSSAHWKNISAEFKKVEDVEHELETTSSYIP